MEKRGKGQDGGGMRKVRRREVMAVVSTAGEFRPCSMGGSVWRDEGRGRGVKKKKRKKKKRHQDEKRKSQ